MMLKRVPVTFVIIVLLAALTYSVVASTSTDHGAEPTIVYVTGEGTVTAEPTQATIHAVVDGRALSASEAEQIAKQRFHAVNEAAERLRLAVTPGHFSLKPVYEYHDGRSTLIGYEARRDVKLTVTDLNKVGEAIESVLKSGVSTIIGVVFEVGDESALRREAIEKAMRDAQDQADTVAAVSGRRLIGMRAVSVNHSGAVRPLDIAVVSKAFAENIDPSPVEMRATVSVEFLMQ